MKKILQFVAVLAFALVSFPAMAQFTQSHQCGLKGEHAAQVKARMMDNRRDMAGFVRQRGAITYVPIKFHLVADNDGEGRLAEGKVLDMLCIVNNEYLQHEIQFYIEGGTFNYVDHSNLYTNPSANSSWLKMQNEKVNNAINVFVILSVGGNTAAYYQPPVGQADWIVIGSAYVYGEAVLSHEIGHFFSLSHPFYGWEGHPWNEAEHGLSVGTYAPSDPSEIGNVGLIQNDRVDQANCTVAADGICDTPPDYLFGFVNGGGCGNYTGGAQDPNGEVADPMENNMMSYFQSCDDYIFTADQVDAIYDDLNHPSRNYVNPGITPPTDDVTSIPVPSFPEQGATVGNESLQFSWSAATGATHYLLEIDRLSSFSFQPQYFITTSTAKTVTTLEPNKSYFWRVRPFTSLKTCTTYSEVIEFETTTGVYTTEIESVDSWVVRPNPVDANQNLIIEINASKNFDATVNVYSMTGQLMRSDNTEFGVGSSTVEVSTAGLTTGMYMVSVQSADGVMTKKVIVR